MFLEIQGPSTEVDATAWGNGLLPGIGTLFSYLSLAFKLPRMTRKK
jgi:hypothetical protein